MYWLFKKKVFDTNNGFSCFTVYFPIVNHYNRWQASAKRFSKQQSKLDKEN